MSDLVQAPALSRLARVMALAGWEIEYADLDLTRERPQAEIKVMRADGRWLWAKVDELGRCTVERFHRTHGLGMSANTKGRRPLSPQINDSFMGRQSYAGPRSMLRDLTSYLTENALQPLSLSDMRAAWAPLMGAPLLLDRTSGEKTK